MEDKDQVQILLTEYEQLWTYYMYSHRSRMQIFDWMLKLVVVPATLTGLIVLAIKTFASSTLANASLQSIWVSQSLSFGGLIMLGTSVTGVFFYAYYCAETCNSHYYTGAINRIRRTIRELGGNELLVVMDLDHHLKRAANLSWQRNLVASFRGLAFASINSMIFASAATMLIVQFALMSNSVMAGPVSLLTSYIASMLFHHYIIYNSIVWTDRHGHEP